MSRRNGGQKIRRHGGNRNWQGNAGEDHLNVVWVNSRKLRHARFRRAGELSNWQIAGTRSGVRIGIRVAPRGLAVRRTNAEKSRQKTSRQPRRTPGKVQRVV